MPGRAAGAREGAVRAQRPARAARVAGLPLGFGQMHVFVVVADLRVLGQIGGATKARRGVQVLGEAYSANGT